MNASLLTHSLSWGTWLSAEHPTRSGGTPSLHASSPHTSACSLLWAGFLRLLLTNQFQSPLRKGTGAAALQGWLMCQ